MVEKTQKRYLYCILCKDFPHEELGWCPKNPQDNAVCNTCKSFLCNTIFEIISIGGIFHDFFKLRVKFWKSLSISISKFQGMSIPVWVSPCCFFEVHCGTSRNNYLLFVQKSPSDFYLGSKNRLWMYDRHLFLWG